MILNNGRGIETWEIIYQHAFQATLLYSEGNKKGIVCLYSMFTKRDDQQGLL